MTTTAAEPFRGNDRLLYGIILGVLAFWLFAQTTLNIAPTMAADLQLEQSFMNIAVSITALFSGIFIVVIGGLADRVGRVRMVMYGFGFSVVGSLLVGFAPSGGLGGTFLMLGRICFVGLGNMGGPMCQRLVQAGYPVAAFDLDRAALDRVVAVGATAAASAAACAGQPRRAPLVSAQGLAAYRNPI